MSEMEGPVPEFLNNPAAALERDMEFVISRARGVSTDPYPPEKPKLDDYAPKGRLPPPVQQLPSRFRVASPEAEEAAIKVAEQAKAVVTQTSSVVRRAIAELQR